VAAALAEANPQAVDGAAAAGEGSVENAAVVVVGGGGGGGNGGLEGTADEMMKTQEGEGKGAVKVDEEEIHVVEKEETHAVERMETHVVGKEDTHVVEEEALTEHGAAKEVLAPPLVNASELIESASLSVVRQTLDGGKDMQGKVGLGTGSCTTEGSGVGDVAHGGEGGDAKG